MEKLLKQKSEGGTLIFTNTREQCDKLTAELTDKGFTCAIYRGDMDRSERRSNYKQFRDKKIDLLVATDLAGRGLDLDHVGRVINYHLPQQMENYLHRVGRTARAGRPGLVINLVTERDEKLMQQLEGKKYTPRFSKLEKSTKNSKSGKLNKSIPSGKFSKTDKTDRANKNDNADKKSFNNKKKFSSVVKKTNTKGKK
jgi:superfamily II DNA/RNA helicase